MFEKFWKYVNNGEEARRSALKPDKENVARADFTNLKGWMDGAGQAGLEGETSEESHEFTAGELHAKAAAKEKMNHPHLELVRKPEVENDEIVAKIETPFQKEREELLLMLKPAQEEAKNALDKVAAIQAKLKALDVKDAMEKVKAA